MVGWGRRGRGEGLYSKVKGKGGGGYFKQIERIWEVRELS